MTRLVTVLLVLFLFLSLFFLLFYFILPLFFTSCFVPVLLTHLLLTPLLNLLLLDLRSLTFLTSFQSLLLLSFSLSHPIPYNQTLLSTHYFAYTVRTFSPFCLSHSLTLSLTHTQTHPLT
jgi:hypothetical protein